MKKRGWFALEVAEQWQADLYKYLLISPMAKRRKREICPISAGEFSPYKFVPLDCISPQLAYHPVGDCEPSSKLELVA